MEGFPEDFNLTNLRTVAVQKLGEAEKEQERMSKVLLAEYRNTIYQAVMRDLGNQSWFDFSLSSHVLQEDVDTLYSELSKLLPGCLKLQTFNGLKEYSGSSNGWRKFRIQI